MASNSANKQHNPYQKYLEGKHGRLNTPNELIREVVKKATNSTLAAKKRIIEGEINEVYEVTTKDKQVVIVRISRLKHPRFDAEKKAIRLALMAGVPAPKVLLIEKTKKDKESLTFCVEEKIEGEPLKKIMNKISKKELQSIISEAGKMLSQIHTVKVNRIGGFDRNESYGSWDEYIINKTTKRKEKILVAAKKAGIKANLLEDAFSILSRNKKHMRISTPKLIHGDYSLKHFLVRKNHIVGIIDFENAKGGDPIFDFAWFNFFNGNEIPIEWLKQGYNNRRVFNKYFDIKMRLYRLNLALILIDYYVSEKNTSGVNYTKKKLLEILNNF